MSKPPPGAGWLRLSEFTRKHLPGRHDPFRVGEPIGPWRTENVFARLRADHGVEVIGRPGFGAERELLPDYELDGLVLHTEGDGRIEHADSGKKYYDVWVRFPPSHDELASAERERAAPQAAASQPSTTGYAGRPDKSRQLLDAELERRGREGLIEPRLSKQAEALLTWLSAEHPDRPAPKRGSLENNIRRRFNELLASQQATKSSHKI